jgi:type III pantothenate kinase
MLLADIGNTHFHIYNGENIEHLSYEEAINKYKDEKLYYICVKHELTFKISNIKQWKNISSFMNIEGDYETMGVDRKALCLSYEDGIFIDAGTAITVDVVEDGRYKGGYIFPGIKAMLETYKNISPALDVELNKDISLDNLPSSTTKDGISYGIIASIKTLIEMHSDGKNIYVTGGDGKFISTFLTKCIYDEVLIFEGIKNAINKNKIL